MSHGMKRGDERGRLAIVLAATTALAAGNVLLRWSIGEALDSGKPGAYLPAVAALLLGVSQLLLYTRQMLSAEMREDIYRRIQRKIQRKILHSSMEALGKNDLGGISARYITDVGQIDGFVDRLLGKALPDLAGWLITVGLLFWLDLLLGIAAILVTALPVLLLRGMSRPVARGTEEYREALERANQSVATGLHNLEAIKASGREEAFLGEYGEKLAALQKKKRNVALWEAVLGLPMLAGAFVTIVLLTGLGGWLVLAGRITSGELLTVIALTENILSFGMGLDGTILRFRRAQVSMGRLKGFLDQEEEREGGREADEIRDIVFEGIHFAYPDSPEKVFRGFSRRWQRGRPCFIKGGNGAGKTTLIKLLTGVYDVTAGRILINGVPIEEYSLASLRERIVVAAQENVLFRGSVLENLTWGLDLSAAEVEEACRRTGIHEEILGMPEGYGTMLTEGGGPLSGGQRQRLCLARALLRRGDVYVFDEPTSALDRANRDRFAAFLGELSEERIVIVITHERELLDAAPCTVEIGAPG